LFVGSLDCYAITSNAISQWIQRHYISTSQSATSLPNLGVLKSKLTLRAVVRLVNTFHIFNVVVY